MIQYKKRYISELCLEYSFGDTIDKEINEKVLTLYRYLLQSDLIDSLHILDIVPSYTSLAIHFEFNSPLFDSSKQLDSLLDNLSNANTLVNSTLHEVYVNYEGEDIEYVSKVLDISVEDIITLHANKEYTIAMIGFRPYFPYLLGLDKKLILPRRDDPRMLVEKGSVAIAAGQTGIYSEDSPGGWHIIGTTTFDKFSELKSGDRIIFKEVKNAN